MADQHRLLVIGSAGSTPGTPPIAPPGWDVVRADSLSHALDLLRDNGFHGVHADPRDPTVRLAFSDLARRGRVLDALSEGVAVVDADLRILWANTSFERCCGGPVTGRGFYEALGSPETVGSDPPPFLTALSGQKACSRLQLRNNRHLELHASPLDGRAAAPLVVVVRDITEQVQQQQRMAALARASEELAPFTSADLAEVTVEERIATLKENIRKLTHELLNYNVIEIRLLDPVTGRLEPLLEEGMTPEAAQRVLYPRPKGNGVTGFVAASGKSYLCSDTCNDPLYIEGSAGARSSLTIPLQFEDRVIGTFNVESPEPNHFGEQEQQFAEIFCREIAAALHTLELLSAEKHGAAARSVEAIRREVALPVDEILNGASCVLERYLGHDPEMSQRLRQILQGARAIKEIIQKVGDDMAPPRTAPNCEDNPTTRLKGKRILVADNDERVRRSAHGVLGRWGCIVETATTAAEALTLARVAGYDAILADIRLPDMSGYEVYRQLCQARPQARVILMTGYGYDPSHALVKARQDGLRYVLFKPFRVDQLRAALETPDPVLSDPPSPPAEVVRA